MSRISIVVSVVVFAISVSALSVSLISASSSAQSRITGVPTQIAYQGYLEDSGGDPLEGRQTVQFNLYESEVSRSPIWQEQHEAALSDGYFSVMLGSNKPLSQDLFEGGSVYLGVAVGREAESARQPLASVPFAIMASNAASASFLDCSGCVTSRQIADGAVSSDKLSGGSSSASLVSPNGQYEIQIDNNGITLVGPDGEIAFVSDGGWQVTSDRDLAVESERELTLSSGQDMNLDIGQDLMADAGLGMSLEANSNINVKSSQSTTIEGGQDVNVKGSSAVDIDGSGQVQVDGGLIRLNGGCSPVASQGDTVTGPSGAGTIVTGSQTVLTC